VHAGGVPLKGKVQKKQKKLKQPQEAAEDEPAAAAGDGDSSKQGEWQVGWQPHAKGPHSCSCYG
jgi:hypothetical protein